MDSPQSSESIDLSDGTDAPCWRTDITDSDLIIEEKANFILTEAKEQLRATVSDAEALTRTGVYLLGGLLTVTTALVGVTASMFDTRHPIANQRWLDIAPLLITSMYLAADALMLMWSALSIKGLDHSGNAPPKISPQRLSSA